MSGVFQVLIQTSTVHRSLILKHKILVELFKFKTVQYYKKILPSSSLCLTGTICIHGVNVVPCITVTVTVDKVNDI